ncbi:MAG: tyrosine-type recombinase/integrase [Desulfobacteraceae bacterium]
MKNNSLIPTKSTLTRALHIVPYLTLEEVGALVRAGRGRHQLRDELLILTLFQTGLRSSEALSITPRRIGNHAGHPVLYIEGKGKKPRMVACPDILAHRLKSYAFDRSLGLDEKIFPINRKRAW